jgi:hypothetical protein
MIVAANQHAGCYTNQRGFEMARKASSGGVNKSEAIRDLLKTNPKISGKDAIDALAAKGIEVKNSLFYLVKGKTLGGRRRRRTAAKNGQVAQSSTTAAKQNDTVATIRKVQQLGNDVGGIKVLKKIIDVLSE